MKTVLLIDASGHRYFQRRGGAWRLVPAPARGDRRRLWVLINRPAEALEAIELPRLFGRDRRRFVERRLAAAFPEKTYRAAHLLSGGLLKPGRVILNGLATGQELTAPLAATDALIVGVWGLAALLADMAAHGLGPPDLLLALPNEQELRLLVVKDRVPVLTRCVQRQGESLAAEILLTRQYLEHQRIFAPGQAPPVLFLGEADAVRSQLAEAGVNLVPVPRQCLPRGEAAWLHPFLERIVCSPPCQLAPLPVRARYLARNLRRAAYGGAAATLLAAALYGQGDIRELVEFHLREQALSTEIESITAEQTRLSALIKAADVDPALVRRATQFEAHEISAAPGADAFLSLAATAIAEVPEARVQTLAFRLTAAGERVCPSQGGEPPRPSAVETAPPSRLAEIQLTIALPGDLPLQAKVEARQRIAAALQAVPALTLWHDPTLSAGAIKGGTGSSLAPTEDHWCLSVPWQTATPAVPAKEP